MRISDEDKLRLCDAYQRGEDYVEFARQLGIKRTTTWSSLSEVRTTAEKFPGVRARRVRISEELTSTAVTAVEEHPEFTLNQVKAELRTCLPHKRPSWPNNFSSCASRPTYHNEETGILFE